MVVVWFMAERDDTISVNAIRMSNSIAPWLRQGAEGRCDSLVSGHDMLRHMRPVCGIVMSVSSFVCVVPVHLLSCLLCIRLATLYGSAS